jgi:tetratricopeptide (TPR) repeat protein
MKAVFRIAFLIAAIAMISTGLYAQRTVKGTVYNNGEPAAGVNVEVHRGGSMMTSFDGKFELEASDKSRWIRFTSVTESKRLDISEKPGDTFDFAFDGKIPSDTDDNGGDDVVLKSAEELIREQDREFMNQLSLFNEFYKQENFGSAMPHWRILYNKYPKSTLNLYIRGVIMYEELIEEANTPAEKEKYIDELMKMYDKRIRHFGEKGFVLGRKATSWLKYNLEDRDNMDLNEEELKEILKKGYDWINESISEQRNKTELPILLLLMQTTRSLFLMNEIPKETVVKNYNTINEILESIRTVETDEERLNSAALVHASVEEIFGTSGAADCEALTNIFLPQFEQNRNDADFVKRMLRRLRVANCDESPFFEQATQQLYELEPSAEAAFNMARRFVRRDEPEKAKEFYLQAMEQETDRELLSRYYYEYAIFIFAKESDLQEARKYARQAIEINPAYCEAITLIGDIYIAASRTFNPGSDFEKSAIFWVAVDYYERARQHSDCAVDAAKKINDYRRYFPSKEDAFFLGLQEGQTYKVGGWVNETTRIRF